MSSIISEKEINKDQETKLKMRQKMKRSLNHKPEQVHTKKRRKKMKFIPQSYKINVHCTSHLQLHFTRYQLLG